MNEHHRQLCPSEEWASFLEHEVLPAVTADVDLGSEMLEIGPGPGASTEWLRHRVGRLVAVEVDGDAADRLARRFADTNVEVRHGDAGALGDVDATYDAVGSFTMLHHVATLAEQRAILAEAVRVLRPGGVLVGSDSLASRGLHDFHVEDTYNPIEPAVLLVLLQSLGCTRIALRVGDVLTFTAHKAATGEESGCPRHDPEETT